ncbi:transposase [Rhodococcus opacus PD630]|uniref:IS1380 family transposase n=1 Tax=Rhodococcus TaxID=1827 RepID=UPI00029CCED8|nr:MULTISPECIES: IS1380 family transposase [Rhodococcus]EHI42219.1 transposase [Rhodococcus opacus PD630]EHI44712.1 transposase [Rhodococcus opacus PD630]KXX60576.1 transposase [Rhodococcus sp. LB1]UDG94673.1 IS1380 family transposase [Rhodococcus opacus PD630]UDG97527.1 IS1380 family transposase [Rhodococcus opacus PD630]
MQLSHTRPVTAAAFDDRNLLASAGLIPVLGLAQESGLADLADEHVSVPTDKGSHPGRKVSALVAGMVAGADSIDDMAVLRHGAMPTVFDRPYAPSTLGSFLRSFTFGHVRQLDAVATRFLHGLAERTPLVDGPEVGGSVLVDLDDTIVPVHGHGKQGSGYGYTGVRGLNALIATATTEGRAPVIVGQRLRRGGCGSPRGAARMVTDAVATVRRLHPRTPGGVLVRADSAFYGHKMVSAAIRAGADVSVTVRMTAKVKAAIAAIDERTWTPIEYTDAVYDEPSGRWISRAEVAEIDFTAFTRLASERTPGRLVVRRIPDLNPRAGDGQGTLFDTWRFHAFFTTTDPAVLDTVAADKVHRGHAIIEQVHADLKNSALAHLPSGRFAANSAWLVLAVMAFNLTRAAATITGTRLARATTATIRRTLITVPARIASSARRLTLHLPRNWPWETEWNQLFTDTWRRKPQAT